MVHEVKPTFEPAPHRIVMAVLVAALIAYIAVNMRWEWLPSYTEQIAQGLWRTLWLLALSVFFGFLLAVPLGLVQVTGPKPLSALALGFCTLIRGTPLLLQLWLLYFGLGFVFPNIPEIRDSFLWPYLRQAWP